MIARLSNLTKEFGALQVKNREILKTKAPPFVTLTYLADKTSFRLDGPQTEANKCVFA